MNKLMPLNKHNIPIYYIRYDEMLYIKARFKNCLYFGF